MMAMCSMPNAGNRLPERWYSFAMKTTIDRAGRVVIPKSIRVELGLRGGEEVEITLRDSRIEIEPASKAVRLVRRDGFLAAEIVDGKPPRLTAGDVRTLLERMRR